MKTRSAWLSAVVAVAVLCPVAMPGGAWGQGQGDVTAQISAEQKMAIRKDLDRQKSQLQAYRKDKKQLRDVYLTMRAMLINYSLIGEAASPEAQKIQKEADELQAKYPKVLNNPPAMPKYVAPKKKPFTPKDVHVMGVWGSGQKIAVKYQFKIEFYQLPVDVTFKDEHGNPVFERQDHSRIGLADLNLRPKSTLSFRRHVEIAPRSRMVGPRILVCTNMLTGYVPVTDDERASLPDGKLPYFRWENEGGTLDDFCGVVSMDGEVVWKLDYRQAVPDRLLHAVDMLPDGSRALIFSGSRVAGSEGAESVGSPKELFIWEYPDKVKRKSAAGVGSGHSDFFLKFRGGEL